MSHQDMYRRWRMTFQDSERAARMAFADATRQREKVRELEDQLAMIGSVDVNEVAASAVESLNFPVYLRKMWSGDEVQEWLKNQACAIRNKKFNDDVPPSKKP